MAVNLVLSEMGEIVLILMNVKDQISIVISMPNVSIKMVSTNVNAIPVIGEAGSNVWTRTNVHLALTHVTITQIALTFLVPLDVNVKLASLVVTVMILTNVLLIPIDVTMMLNVQTQ